jgi:hypothetical protein
MRITVSVVAFAFIVVSSSISAQPATPFEMRIVLFTPADVEPPEDVEERIAQVVEYTRRFYTEGMKQQGYEPATPLRVPLDENGRPVVLYVKGEHDQASGKYNQLGYGEEVRQAAAKKYGVPLANQVWWVFSYPGPPNRAYRGGGNALAGGYSSANFKVIEGDIHPDDNLSEGVAQEFLLKATIHELGHALGLPHIGPLQKDKAGNSLMGPVTKAYASRYPGDSRVYLTKTSAAMLYKHPLFNPPAKERPTMPSVTIAELQIEPDAQNRTLKVTGRLESDQTAHSVIIADEPRGMRGGYWRKSYTERLNDDGSFEVLIDEMTQPVGQLKIVFVFENGAIKGEANRLGLEGGIVKPYSMEKTN